MLFHAVPSLAASAVLLTGLTACGSNSSSAATSTHSGTAVSPSAPTSVTPPAASSGSSGGAGATQLIVHYVPDVGKPAEVWTLTCDPTGGNHPYARQSCAMLDKAAAAGQDPFAKTKVGVMCTMIYGGPQTATVTGTWRGKPVNATFTRKNGCEVHRWLVATPLVGVVK